MAKHFNNAGRLLFLNQAAVNYRHNRKGNLMNNIVL